MTHLRYASNVAAIKFRFRRGLFVASNHINSSSRPWECGNPEGISRECGKGGKPAIWLSMLSILCHFHGLLWRRGSEFKVTETLSKQPPAPSPPSPSPAKSSTHRPPPTTPPPQNKHKPSSSYN